MRQLHARRPVAEPGLASEPITELTQPVPRPYRWNATTTDDIVAAVQDDEGRREGHFVRGTRMILRHLADLPGESWTDRWLAFESESWQQRWTEPIAAEGTPRSLHEYVTRATVGLMRLDVVRPSYQWMWKKRFQTINRILEIRDPASTAVLTEALTSYSATSGYVRHTLNTVARILAHTGASSVRDLVADELLEPFLVGQSLGGQWPGMQIIWRTLHELGWITTDKMYLPTRQQPPLTPTQMVDYYGLKSPHREVMIEYLTTRSPEVDYNTLRLLAFSLIARFWKQIQDENPDLADFGIDKKTADAWKSRSFDQSSGDLHAQHYATLFAVRAFYADIASWAVSDSYWARWVAPCPVSRSDIRGYVRHARRQVATMQQRTRILSGLLPKLLDHVETHRRVTAERLQLARQAGPGGTVAIDGEPWEVFQATDLSRLRLRRNGKELRVEGDEELAFWTWAYIEVLRLTGLRSEEVFELTHLSLQPYRIPETGETVPLVHIAPSKTDEERLLVAGPELVHVLAQVIHRARRGRENIPLTQRWDPHEHVLSEPLPHLFARQVDTDFRVISSVTAYGWLRKAADEAQLEAGGQAMRFSAHDFRRVFATDALSNGLPPHIVQVLLGHKSLATTQRYAAIYPEDVIRHHRTFIAQRRQTRPAAEYREPTAEEWAQFQSHFVQRKVSLGDCGRAYGTACQHEHACLRCSLLHTDPAQITRLAEIIVNLEDRIVEAENEGWLGEVDGLRISLSGAQDKFRQMQQQTANGHDPVLLGMPPLPDGTPKFGDHQ